MSRFVVLEHESPRGRHWDFMFQTGSVLATWALGEPPDLAEPVVCEALPDHRLEYLDYEGPISGGRGSVSRWDRGACVVERRTDAKIVLALEGDKLTGRVTLARVPGETNRWRFSYAAEGSKPSTSGDSGAAEE